ncbi:MAG: hypothetical protein FWB99_01015 [Treponema sp.]|nr:hypothetical protein [Treponema sp.]
MKHSRSDAFLNNAIEEISAAADTVITENPFLAAAIDALKRMDEAFELLREREHNNQYPD